MFNSKAIFNVPVLSGGVLRVDLRFPTDAQWCERQRSIRVIERRHQQRKTVGEEEASAKLFDALLVGNPVDWEPEEKSAAIDYLEKCEVVSVDHDNDVFLVTMNVPGARVIHTLGIPRMKAMRKYGEVLYVTENNSRESVTRRALEPSGDLWSSVLKGVSGYAPGSSIPIIHQDIAIQEVMQAATALLSEPAPEGQPSADGQTVRG